MKTNINFFKNIYTFYTDDLKLNLKQILIINLFQ